MNRKTWMIGALCAALLPLGAMAQGAHGHFEGGMHGPDSEMLAGVTLTDAQKTQIQTIHQAAWTQAKPLMDQMHSLHQQIDAVLYAAGAVNATQLAALRAQEVTVRQQLEDLHMSTLLQIRATLTAAQLATAATTHAQLESLHEQMHSLMHTGATPPDMQ